MEGLGINLGYLLVQIIAFIVIYTLLTRFVYDPLINVLSARRQRIARGLEDAAQAASARMNAEAEAAKVLEAARREAQSVIDEARNRAEEVGKSVEAEARAEAENIRAQARQAAVDERNQQLAGLRNQVAAISVAVAERLIGENMDGKRQQTLINDFFTKLPEGVKSLTGQVEVVSAMPLEEAEQKTIRKQLGSSDVTFAVDPSILGGRIIRSGDRVIDGSIRRGLGEVTARLN